MKDLWNICCLIGHVSVNDSVEIVFDQPSVQVKDTMRVIMRVTGSWLFGISRKRVIDNR